MEHSRLLKYLVPERLSTMAEPVKIKFEYQNPENVEAEVPGAQKLRQPQFESETGEALPNDGGNSSSNIESGDSSKENPENGEQILNSEPNSDGAEVIPRNDRRHIFKVKRNGIHGEPVMLDKVDDKKSRIPISRFRQTVEKVKEERRGKKERDSHIPVRRSSIPKPVKENKSQPTTTKKEVTVTKTSIKNDSAEPTVTETVVTKETGPNITKTLVETITTTTTTETIESEDEFDKIYAEIVTDTPTEILLDDNLLNPKVEDPEKLESKFEEIIHDYDEHKVEPIDVEVIRRSKLPLLKRKSQQEVELSAQAERTSKIIAARDKLRLRYSMNKDENFEEALDKELANGQKNNKSDSEENNANSSGHATPKIDTKTETETKHEIISSPNSRTEIKKHFTKTISTSSTSEKEQDESLGVVETTIVKAVSTNESNDKKENVQHVVTEENIIKGSIKIGIPVFDSYVHEYSETNETSKTTEVKRVLSYTSKTEELSVTNNVSEINHEITVSNTEPREMNEQPTKIETNNSYGTNNQQSKTETVINSFERQASVKSKDENNMSIKSENTDKPETTTENKTKIDEDVQLRGKVERIISKIDSREVIETEGNQRESINELRKKKSVLSKIAMFERKPEDPNINKPRKESKLPKLATKEWQKVEHVHVHTPLIVDEVFKPFASDISLSNNVDKEKTDLTDNAVTTLVRAERVTVEDSQTVHYAAENKVEIETKTEIAKPSEVVPSQNDIETIHKKAVEVDLSKTITDTDSESFVQKVETIKPANNESNIINEVTIISSNEQVNKFDFTDFRNRPENTLKLRISREVSKSNDIGTARVDANKFDFNDARNKTLSPTRLSMTKELQSPITIPGFRPVSQLLRSFESMEESSRNYTKRSISKIEHKTVIHTPVKTPEIAEIIPSENLPISTQISHTGTINSEIYDDFEIVNDYKSLDDVFSRDTDQMKLKSRQEEDLKRAKSLAELDLGDAVKGKVNNMILRMRSVDRMELDRKEVINKKEMPRKRSVSEKIALFEGKLTTSKSESPLRILRTDLPREQRTEQNLHSRTSQITEVRKTTERVSSILERVNSTKIETVTQRIENNVEHNSENEAEDIQKRIEELLNAKIKYGRVESMPTFELSNGMAMPVLSVGTALLDPRLTHHIVTAAIDLGYRAIDCAFVYGNEKVVGDAIRAKIADGTVTREDLFITNKLWSTYHRTDLVETACKASLEAMGLDYFDLYLIHNPMSFKEGGDLIPKIASVLQYSSHDYLDAWYGMEALVAKGLVRAIGVSNFNSVQLQRVLDKGRIKPVVSQVESHPYLSQQKLELFCGERNIALMCYGVLGSKGTPATYRSEVPDAIDDPLVIVMASGLGITPAQLLISYQLASHRSVTVKASSARRLHENLLALRTDLTPVEVDALSALNKNRRTYAFRGMGDTHRNYPFNVAF